MGTMLAESTREPGTALGLVVVEIGGSQGSAARSSSYDSEVQVQRETLSHKY